MRWHIFYAPWLVPDAAPPVLRVLGESLRAEERFRVVEIRLEVGQTLIVDNHRMLHGRRALCEGSKRRLKRFWIGAPPSCASGGRAA